MKSSSLRRFYLMLTITHSFLKYLLFISCLFIFCSSCFFDTINSTQILPLSSYSRMTQVVAIPPPAPTNPMTITSLPICPINPTNCPSSSTCPSTCTVSRLVTTQTVNTMIIVTMVNNALCPNNCIMIGSYNPQQDIIYNPNPPPSPYPMNWTTYQTYLNAGYSCQLTGAQNGFNYYCSATFGNGQK